MGQQERFVSGELMSAAAPASPALRSNDVVEAEYVVLEPAASTSSRGSLHRPTSGGIDAGGMAALRRAAGRPRFGSTPGGFAFWLFGLTLAAAAFWISGGHALFMR